MTISSSLPETRLKTKGMLMLNNPFDEKITRPIKIPLYRPSGFLYAGAFIMATDPVGPANRHARE